MEYKTRQWHEKCFCCVVCKNPIGTKSFIPREQEIYCATCYEDKFATRCVKCNKVRGRLNGGLPVFSGKVASTEFIVSDHQQRRRDVQERAVAQRLLHLQQLQDLPGWPAIHLARREALLQRVLRRTLRQEMHRLLQADHRYLFLHFFSTPCSIISIIELSRAIVGKRKRCGTGLARVTGIGGTRFISFEDRHWHNDCFICAGCKVSLVGRGFITDEEDIICPDCAKSKVM